MTLMLEYVRKKLVRRRGVHFGQVSCNRVYLSVAIYLAYVYLIPHEGSKTDFLLKRILPFVCSLMAGYGIYYGLAGLQRDAGRIRAVVGILMNAVCLMFHGIAMYWQINELYYAYRFDHGVIMLQFR